MAAAAGKGLPVAAATTEIQHRQGACTRPESVKQRKLEIISGVKRRRPENPAILNQDLLDTGTPCKKLMRSDSHPTPEKEPMAKNQQVKVCGPEFIQTLRGHLLGREVAIICCGEVHENALDLTREHGILEPVRGWVEVPRSGAPGFHPKDACKSKRGLTVDEAKRWAYNLLWEEDAQDSDGVVLLYQFGEGSTKGVAHFFDVGKKPRTERGMVPSTLMFKWFDQDVHSRADKERMAAGRNFKVKVHDATIAKRKQRLKLEGLQLFDEWLVQRYQENMGSQKSNISVDFVFEGVVPLSELELHVEPGVPKAPPAHECLRAIELDSETDEEDEINFDDGCGSFASYLTRRVEEVFSPEDVHGVDARCIGCPEDCQSELPTFKTLVNSLPKDSEELELKRIGAKYPEEYTSSYDVAANKIAPYQRYQLPSWELFFGQAAECLYYSGPKADYAGFLATCLPTVPRVFSFFEELHFGTVPKAISHLGVLDDNARSLTRVRSLAHRSAPGRALERRPPDFGALPVKVAPIHNYLKARGSQPPRTWVSGLAQKLRALGGEEVVLAVESWYFKCVKRLLANPKDADRSGDYFAAWLRESFPKVYKGIDISDPSVVRESNYMPNLYRPQDKKRGHYIGNLKVPSLTKALEELHEFSSGDMVEPSTKRQRVTAQIIVDAFQLRLVDVAAILKVATIVASAPAGSRLAIVFYGGSDHTSNMTTFFRAQGFSPEGLPRAGLVDGRSRQPGKSCGLKMPDYLNSFELLFPVP